MTDNGLMWPVSAHLSCILVCTLIYNQSYQYFRGVQVPCVLTEVYHTEYENYLRRCKVYKCTFVYILEKIPIT